MKFREILALNVPAFALLGLGTYLLMNNHPDAGGALIFFGVLSIATVSFTRRESES